MIPRDPALPFGFENLLAERRERALRGQVARVTAR